MDELSISHDNSPTTSDENDMLHVAKKTQNRKSVTFCSSPEIKSQASSEDETHMCEHNENTVSTRDDNPVSNNSDYDTVSDTSLTVNRLATDSSVLNPSITTLDEQKSLENNAQGEHTLQCLSTFFSKPEKLALDHPQAILSVQNNHFFVVPNRHTKGQTLFRSLGHALTGEEQDHHRIRKIITNYIITAGWDALGKHVIKYYQRFIDEIKKETGNQDFLRKAYKYHFVNGEMEGSLVELIAASILYDFSYTCVLSLAVSMNDQGGTKSGVAEANVRVIHSFHENMDNSGDLLKKQRYFFLRIGESSGDWKWNLLVACERSPSPKVNLSQNQGDTRQIKVSRGAHIGKLWNVYNFQWSRTLVPKSLNHPKFRWENGTSVIATTSGKLLGGYTSVGRDLLSNVCWVLYKNFGMYNTLRNSVSTCALSYPLLLASPLPDNKPVSTHLMKCNGISSVGTLEDLHKASIICRFSYQVIGINEHGELYDLASFRRRGRDRLYFLARTQKGVVTRWCGLDEMRELNPESDNMEYGTSFSKLDLSPVRDPYTKICHGPFGIRYRKDYGITANPWKNRNDLSNDTSESLLRDDCRSKENTAQNLKSTTFE